MGLVEWIDGDEQHAGSSDEVQPSQRDKDIPLCFALKQSKSFVDRCAMNCGVRVRGTAIAPFQNQS